jgi:hypothetical protein
MAGPASCPAHSRGAGGDAEAEASDRSLDPVSAVAFLTGWSSGAAATGNASGLSTRARARPWRCLTASSVDLTVYADGLQFHLSNRVTHLCSGSLRESNVVGAIVNRAAQGAE